MRIIHTNMSKAGLATALLKLDGEPYSLEKYPMFIGVFNSRYPRRLMRAGRQVSKTTCMAADMLVSTVTQPYTTAIYCNASAKQTHAFSRSRLKGFITQSKYVNDSLSRGSEKTDQVYHKAFSNQSEIILRYFSCEADRVRGLSGKLLYLDEVQDMLFDAIIDAEECLSGKEKPEIIYAGTSKSKLTPLEFIWEKSTQKVWLIPCTHCGVSNIPSRENIGKHGLICKKCGGSLNTYDGNWYAMGKVEDGKKFYADGFWIPQIIMPIHCCNDDKWERLLQKLETYPELKFDNEVMGLPSGDGESPITEEMLKAICNDNMQMSSAFSNESCGGSDFIVAGIDWGGGGSMGVSRTVLSIYAVFQAHKVYRKIFGKIYDEGEPVNHVRDIATHIQRFNVSYAAGDFGGGNFAMSALRDLVSDTTMVVPVMYTESSKAYNWNEGSKMYTVNRTVMIDEFFQDIQRKRIEAFCWNQFEPFARDILNIKQVWMGEERGISKRVWRHSPSSPDDSLHSMVFGWFMARVLSGHTDFNFTDANEV